MNLLGKKGIIHYTPVILGITGVLCVLLIFSRSAFSTEPQPTTPSLRLIKYTGPLNQDLSGDRQIGTINEKLPRPIILKVVDEKDIPQAGVEVEYKILSQPEGIRTPAEVQPLNNGLTDVNGIYRAFCRLGDKMGEYEILFYTIPHHPNVEPAFLTIKLTAKRPNWGNWLILGLLGGLAIFLYGMEITSDGLQGSSGLRLRTLISDVTRKPLMGVGVGTLVTFLLQSSSATTTMLVSLVSARLMTLRQALVIIPGAAIGTTITVQLISFNILEYSLPMIAIGFFIYMVARNRRTKAFGSVILGFGLIFFGMKIMTDVIAPLKELPFFSNAMTALSDNPFWALVFSALFTAMIQSSGATLGLVIALSHQGSITLLGAIPIIFGANIGTCITAILASLGASREAKRVAWGHLIYKVIGVAVFYPFMNQLAIAAQWFTNLLSGLPIGVGGASVARQVANTHTLYNVIIALLILPFIGEFEKLIRRIMPQKPGEVQEVRSKYLELQILESPSIAIGSVMREVSRMGRFVQEQMRAIGEVIFNRAESEIEFIHQRDDKIDQLQISITRYLANLTQKKLTDEELEKSIGLLYIVKDLENIGDIIDKNLVPLGEKIIMNNLRFSPEGEQELKDLYRKVMEDLSRVVVASSTWDERTAMEVVEHKEMLKYRREELMLKHLRRLQEGLKETIETSSVHMDIINYLLRVEFYAYRIARVITGQIIIEPKEEKVGLEREESENKD